MIQACAASTADDLSVPCVSERLFVPWFGKWRCRDIRCFWRKTTGKSAVTRCPMDENYDGFCFAIGNDVLGTMMQRQLMTLVDAEAVGMHASILKDENCSVIFISSSLIYHVSRPLVKFASGVPCA